MASNSFGKLFRMTTWGESHGAAIGVVIDGCPAGLCLDEDQLNQQMACRAPGKTRYTSPRKESDQAKILSGLFEGQTTGAPISILISNCDADPSKYEETKHLLKPGHANYTYLKKYGIFDYRGGGRASARETACRVAAGYVAKEFIRAFGVEVIAYIKQIGSISASLEGYDVEHIRRFKEASPLFCPDEQASLSMGDLLDQVRQEGDSLGGVVEFRAHGVPVGLGEPLYYKLEAQLALALMGLPASKGFEIGSGFSSAAMQGSLHNDLYDTDGGDVVCKTNHAGGVLGGVSTGMPVVGRVAFKPASSIGKRQKTLTLSGQKAVFELPLGSRHDPCVAIRAVPVVEAMVAIVLADALLLSRTTSRLKEGECCYEHNIRLKL